MTSVPAVKRAAYKALPPLPPPLPLTAPGAGGTSLGATVATVCPNFTTLPSLPSIRTTPSPARACQIMLATSYNAFW